MPSSLILACKGKHFEFAGRWHAVLLEIYHGERRGSMKIRLIGQMVLQVLGLMYAEIKHGEKEADIYTPQIEYSLPFCGEWYTANGGVTKNTSHSWEILPQRFAYDFIIVDEEGKSYSGDRKNLKSYYCYGKDILAPADGIVISIKNNFPDCRIMENEQTDPDTPDIGGNRIIIKHSPTEYSAICHLMPKSVTVRSGQTVKRGDVIARCGNSGNTSEPHVHFQGWRRKKETIFIEDCW